MMRYIALAVSSTSYLRCTGGSIADFDGEGIGRETIWLREVVDDHRVRLRNLAHGGYLGSPADPSRWSSSCRMLRHDDPATIWTEVAPTGEHFSYETAGGRFLTASPWIGYGKSDGQSGVYATTRSTELIGVDRTADGRVSAGDATSMFLSYVPPDALLPWPGNGRGSVEEYIARHSGGVRGLLYSALDRAGREKLAREMQLTIEPDVTLSPEALKNLTSLKKRPPTTQARPTFPPQ
ncbi:hypothetical protein [Microbacterium sp. bgisy203]|uniref:hypothetical protein n=1 Tax=Microbacterium sp. bgisy203 TaxID=3413799 RepID=UPI003D7633C4